MTHTARLFRPVYLILLLSLAACTNVEARLAQVQPGMSRQEVRDLLGEPDQAYVSTLPEGYFFGPQEGLVDLIPAGGGYEEWIYQVGDDDFYVWFSGEGNAMERWTVIRTARYPRDAVW